jgi:hypothetical protein
LFFTRFSRIKRENKRGVGMPICAMCGGEIEYVTKCKMCGQKFCAECGKVDEKLCIYCQEDDDDLDDDDLDDDDLDDYDFNDMGDWNEKQRLVERFYK